MSSVQGGVDIATPTAGKPDADRGTGRRPGGPERVAGDGGRVADDVLLEWRDGVAIVTNNRPHKLNATSDAFNRRLWEVFYAINTNDDVRAVVWKANGPSFSSGRDLSELGGSADNDMSHLQHIERGHRWTQMLLDCPAPIVVGAEGMGRRRHGRARPAVRPAHRVASPPSSGCPKRATASCRTPVAWRGSSRSPGTASPLDMALTCRVLEDAEEALHHGVVSRLLPDDEVDDAAIEMAEAIAALPAFTVKLIRRDIARMATHLVQESMRGGGAPAGAGLRVGRLRRDEGAPRPKDRDPVYRRR